MWFDLHADIGYDMYQQHLLGNDKRFQEYHLPKLLNANIKGVCVACFFGSQESWEVMQDCVTFVRQQLDTSDVHLVCSKEDLEVKTDKLMVMLTIEGMYGIQDDVQNKIQWLYDQGVRIGSLCWNEENTLATGVKGNSEHGITALGKEAIAKMKQLGMILDVSHLNDKSFYDVMKMDIPVIATHSNARQVCLAMRNLTDDQLVRLKEKKALVGINAAGFFVHDDVSKRDCAHFVKQVQYLESILGLNHIGCGFDFMDYYEDENLMLFDLKDCTELPNFEHALSSVYTKKDILKIASQNTLQFLKNNL